MSTAHNTNTANAIEAAVLPAAGSLTASRKRPFLVLLDDVKSHLTVDARPFCADLLLLAYAVDEIVWLR